MTDITEHQDIFRLLDLYFNNKFILYSYQWHSYNQFISDILKHEIVGNEHIISEEYNNGKLYINKIIFENVSIKPPIDDLSNDEAIIFPEDCRTRFLTYASKIIADVTHFLEIKDIESHDNNIEKIIIAKENNVAIAKVPIMVRSDYCSLNIKKNINNTECRYDPGCYFIVKGSEKVVIGLERLCDNKMLCFTKKDTNYANGLKYICQVNSKNTNYEDYYNNNIQAINVNLNKYNSIVFNMSHFSEIPIFTMFRALGVVTDNDILRYIMKDSLDTDMLNILKLSINKSVSETIKDDDGNFKQIKSQEDAMIYLISKLRNKRYSTTSIEININQKRKHLETILSRDLFPHMGITYDKIPNKIFYLGRMVNKLLNTYIGRIQPDDRDSFINKRISLPGALMGQLFRQYFKKMINDCSKIFYKKNKSITNSSINAITLMKFSTIEQGLISALSVGVWGKPELYGIAQMMQRLSYRQTMSFHRKIMPPPSKNNTTKVIQMRHVNNIQYGYIDIIETPDGKSVGIHKHLSLMCTVTVNQSLIQIDNIKKIIKEAKYNNEFCLIELNNIRLDMFYNSINVNVNGELLGITLYPYELIKILKYKRLTEINKQTSK